MHDPALEHSPVQVGTMLYTQVDPERGAEVAYNRWYERDHFYAGCMIGPGFFSGRRWVATRELKSLRLPEGETTFCTPVTAGSYLAIYWVLDGMQEENLRWGTDQVNWLLSDLKRGGAVSGSECQGPSLASPGQVTLITSLTGWISLA